MDAKLVIVGGKANKTQVSLKLPSIVGRSREADLTIAHPMVSRQHCEIYEDNGLLMVRDLGSLNGTFVRQQRITQAVPVYPNDELTVGPLTFRAEYEYVGEIATAPTPPARPQPAAQPEPMLMEQPPGLYAAGQEEPPPTTDTPAAAGKLPSTVGTPAGVESEGGLPDFAAWDQAGRRTEPATPPVGAMDFAAPEPAPAAPPEPRAEVAPSAEKQPTPRTTQQEFDGFTLSEPAGQPVADFSAFGLETPQSSAAREFSPLEPEAAGAAPGAGPSAEETPYAAPGEHAASRAAEASKKKKTGWWPFGNEKGKAAPAAKPAKPEPQPAPAGQEPVFGDQFTLEEPAAAEEPTQFMDDVGPLGAAAAAGGPAGPTEPAKPAAKPAKPAKPAEEDDALDEFLKGLL